MRVSVAMAVYNGEKYLKETIESIVSQLTPQDELIVSYNPSDDNTLNILGEERAKHSIIKVVLCKEIGKIPNFENAIAHCSREIIMPADQDCPWHKDKVERVKQIFVEDNAFAVIHNAVRVNAEGNILEKDLFQTRKIRRGYMHNALGHRYTCACMAFQRSIIGLALPFPRNVESYEQWLGLLAEKVGQVSYVNEKLIDYREDKPRERIGFLRKAQYLNMLIHEFVKRVESELNLIYHLQALYPVKKIKKTDTAKKEVITPPVEKQEAEIAVTNNEVQLPDEPEEEDISEEDFAGSETMMYMVQDLKPKESDSENTEN